MTIRVVDFIVYQRTRRQVTPEAYAEEIQAILSNPARMDEFGGSTTQDIIEHAAMLAAERDGADARF